MNRHKFHDVACQVNLKFCQGIVREMSGNFVSTGVWQPCSCLLIHEPRCEKTGLWDFQPGLTQTRLYNHIKWLEAGNLVFRK